MLAWPAAGARDRTVAQGRKLHRPRPGVPPDQPVCPAGHGAAAAGEPQRRDCDHHAGRFRCSAQRRQRGGPPEQHQRIVRRTGRRELAAQLKASTMRRRWIPEDPLRANRAELMAGLVCRRSSDSGTRCLAWIFNLNRACRTVNISGNLVRRTLA